MATTHNERCKHYRGIVSDVCAAGINIRQLAGDESGLGYRIPCIYLSGISTAPQRRVPCDHFQTKTAKEQAEEEAFFELAAARFLAARPIIEDFKARHVRQNARETVDCPTGCGGRLTMSIAAYNGHTSGRCTTNGCLAWLE